MVDDPNNDRLLRVERDTAETKHGLVNLRQVIEIRLNQLAEDITELKSALKWAGGLIISLMISFMAWAALQQYNANEEQKSELQTQIDLIARQKIGDTQREEILQQLRESEGTATVRDDASITRDALSDDRAPNLR